MEFTSDNKMQFSLYGDTTSTPSLGYNTGVWVHCAFVYNKVGNGMSIFRDGFAQAPSSTVGNSGTSQGPTSATGPIHLGVWNWRTSIGPFNGEMDEFLLFEGRALTAPEALAIAKAGSTLNTVMALTISLSFDTGTDLGEDYSCGGSNDAASVTGVAAARGVVCGSVSAVSLACDSR